MERHSVDEADAFGMLRDHSRRTKHPKSPTSPLSSTAIGCYPTGRTSPPEFEGWFKSSRPD
jgi:hypothetical protein